MNLYFKLIGESMRKIWLRFSDPRCHPWVVSPGMSLYTYETKTTSCCQFSIATPFKRSHKSFRKKKYTET
jgi:hypothetical protein